MKKVVVVGAGIGGLVAAARLSATGLEVTVFEQNSEAGGKLGFLQRNGFSWDTGPSLFTQPQLLETLFADCDKELSRYFSYRSLGEGTQYFWEGGQRFNAAPQREALLANASAAFGDAAGRLPKYLDDAANLYKRIGRIFLDYPIHRIKTWSPVRVLPAFPALKPGYLTKSLHGYNAAALQHPQLVQIMDRMATYNGSDPYACPAMLSMIAHLEFGEGAWYADGGMIAIPRALRALCGDLGVQFITGEKVTRIIHDRGRVQGVEVRGERLSADAVVSNADVYATYRHLLQDAVMTRRIERQERSSSGVVFYWGMSRTFPELRLHNIFFSEDYKAEFGQIFGLNELPADPTVYVNISSKQDAAHAPAGGEAWFVLINAPAGTQPLSEEVVARLRDTVVQKISRALGRDVAAHIACEEVMTPEGISRATGAHLGALYGTASNAPMAAFNRHPNATSRYRGLAFAGGTVHPGGGIPLCVRSGGLAAAEVLRYLKMS